MRLTLPYTHSLMVLRLHLSSSTIYGHVPFLFHEFSVRENPVLTLRRHNRKIHIGEVHIVSII